MTITTPGPGAGAAEQVLLGRYRLQELIGRGGMAAVYLALDTVLNRPVAVKVLHPHLCRERSFVEQFLEMELRIARLFHPHLVTIFDAGQTEETCLVVMEYVPGGSLGQLIAQRGAAPVEQALRTVAQVADALELLHQHGIIHGDVKPDNILLDGDGQAKLVDFGIAHLATTTGALQRDTLEGSAPYLAPEQLREGRADHRSDIYALGLVAYELLAGRRAFEGHNWTAVAAQRLVRDPAPLTRVRSDLPRAAERLIMTCLAREPERRWPSAAALRDALLTSLRDAARQRGERSSGRWRVASGERELDRQVGTNDEEAQDHTPTETRTVRAPAVRNATSRALSARSGPTGAVSRLGVQLQALIDSARAERPAASSHLRRLGWRLRDGTRALVQAVRRGERTAVLGVGLLALGLLLVGLAVPRLLAPPQPVRVPEVVGKSLDVAKDSARAAGIGLNPSHEPSETIPRGVVVRQTPAPNVVMMSGQSLAVVVSSGPPPVRVPDVRQRRLEDARADLAAARLSVGKVEEREVASQPWGIIVAQSVAAGGEAPRGNAIDLTVGVPPWTQSPQLIDRPLGDAEEKLAKQGLRLGAVKLEPVAGKRAGTVVAQEPAPDVRLRQGEVVSVTIAVPQGARP